RSGERVFSESLGLELEAALDGVQVGRVLEAEQLDGGRGQRRLGEQRGQRLRLEPGYGQRYGQDQAPLLQRGRDGLQDLAKGQDLGAAQRVRRSQELVPGDRGDQAGDQVLDPQGLKACRPAAQGGQHRRPTGQVRQGGYEGGAGAE